jgi:hypothetical protein
VQEGVLLVPYIHEGGVEAGGHLAHLGQVNIAHGEAALGPLPVQLAQHLVLQQGDSDLAAVGTDDQIDAHAMMLLVCMESGTQARAERQRLKALGLQSAAPLPKFLPDLLLVAVLPQALLALVGGHLVAFPLLSAGHVLFSVRVRDFPIPSGSHPPCG